jgi:hypothetical protein
MTKKQRETERARWEKHRQEMQPWWDAYFRARHAYLRARREQPQRCEAVISKFERGSGMVRSAAAFKMYDMAGMSVGELTSLADMLASLDGAVASPRRCSTSRR